MPVCCSVIGHLFVHSGNPTVQLNVANVCFYKPCRHIETLHFLNVATLHFFGFSDNAVLFIWVWFKLKIHLVTHFVSLNVTEKCPTVSSEISLSVSTITAGKYVKIPWFCCTSTGGNFLTSCPNDLVLSPRTCLLYLQQRKKEEKVKKKSPLKHIK